MLLNYEKEYKRKLNAQYVCLTNLYENIKRNETFSLRKKDITEAILFRMKSYYDTQNRIKEFLNKRYVPAAADFFVETVAFYLKLFLDKRKVNFEVHSEKQIKPERGAMRPDISLWVGDRVIAMIECKTQLGWNRFKWENDFQNREKKLKKIFPKAKAFLLVMTSENWAGFLNNKKSGKQYFVLSSKWPPSVIDDNFESVIINPIEGLFKQIILIVGK